MSPAFDASRSLTALEQDSTIIAVIEMSQSKWLVAPIVPGIKRQPLKKIDADEKAVVKLLDRWCKEAGQTGQQIKRIVVALAVSLVQRETSLPQVTAAVRRSASRRVA